MYLSMFLSIKATLMFLAMYLDYAHCKPNTAPTPLLRRSLAGYGSLAV